MTAEIEHHLRGLAEKCGNESAGWPSVTAQAVHFAAKKGCLAVELGAYGLQFNSRSRSVGGATAVGTYTDALEASKSDC